MKKFTESIKTVDIFEDEDTLRDILLDYSDDGLKWSIKYKLFKIYNDGDSEWYMSVLDSNKREVLPGQFNSYGNGLEDFFDKSDNAFPKDAIRGYHISFTEVFTEILANDKQRGDNRRNFGVPNNKLYKFFDTTKYIQEKIESMGYVFLLSVHQNAEFDILIIDKN